MVAARTGSPPEPCCGEQRTSDVGTCAEPVRPSSWASTWWGRTEAFRFVGRSCHPRCVDLTRVDLEKIPAENLHVARAEFVRVWAAVERHQDAQLARHVPDWYGGGIQAVCRWLARATVRPAGGQWHPARSPVTGRQDRAYPELIDAECLAADLLDQPPSYPALAGRAPGLGGVDRRHARLGVAPLRPTADVRRTPRRQLSPRAGASFVPSRDAQRRTEVLLVGGRSLGRLAGDDVVGVPPH